VRLRLHDIADSLRGQRDARVPPPVVGVVMVVAATAILLLAAFALAAIAGLFA
jgi:hypothetical protein